LHIWPFGLYGLREPFFLAAVCLISIAVLDAREGQEISEWFRPFLMAGTLPSTV
jgi:hypothetical protein